MVYRKRKQIYDPDSGVPPTAEQVKRLKQYAYNVVVGSLARSDKSVTHVRQILLRKNVPANIVEETIEEFTTKRMLDDRRMAERFYQTRKDAMSVREMKTKLSSKGVPYDIVEDVVLEDEPQQQYEKCLVEARRKFRSISRFPTREERVSRLVKYLTQNRGYGFDVADMVAQDAVDELEGLG